MNTKDLLKEAIADAKTVRETALAQAKLALEEAFTPRLQSMFAAKLQEMEDDEMKKDEDKMEEAKDKMVDEVEADEAKEKMEEKADMEEFDDDDNSLEEIDLDEILAELDAELSEEKDELKEAKDEDEIEAEEDVEDEEADEEEDEEEEKEVSELSMDELEELIRDIVSQEMGPDGEDTDINADVDVDAELPDTTDDEVNLDEILAELLGEDMDELDERKKYGGNKGDVPAGKRGDKKDTAEEEGDEDYKKKKKKMEEELQLALEAVNTLRQELQEVNLLNAKLLYVNKIFKAKNLTESQKIKVVKAFDKAESAKEAKLVFESLSETFAAKVEKSQIKESLGFASKAVGVATKPTNVIVESNEFIARMKKLANIK